MAKPVEADVVLSCNEHLPTVDVWLVIDVLRATTVIVRWFELGGRELYPTDTPDAARRLAHDLEQEGRNPLLMGEENAITPQGFDLGNSPLDLTRELAAARECAVMATTNGTKALLRAAETGVPVFAACIRNASSALGCALSRGSRIGLLCSGRKGRPSWDDTLCAGLLLGGVTLFVKNLLAALFTPDPGVRDAVAAVLVVIGCTLVIASWVTLFDGVLIGAGDGPYLARASLITLAVYAPLALAVARFAPGGVPGLVWLWLAFTIGFMGARAATLWWRERSDAWLVTG